MGDGGGNTQAAPFCSPVDPINIIGCERDDVAIAQNKDTVGADESAGRAQLIIILKEKEISLFFRVSGKQRE